MEKFDILHSINHDFSTNLYPNNATTPLHFHNSYEILLVLKGAIICSVDGASFQCSTGQAIFLCPLQLHKFSSKEDTIVRSITFHEHLILTVHQSIKNSVAKSPVFPISQKIHNFASQLLEGYFGTEDVFLPRITPQSKRMKIKGLLYLLSGEFLESAQMVSISKQANIGMEIVEYIAQNYKDHISLHDIANAKGYNYHYLSRKFNQYTGMTFKKMLNLYRAQQAFLLLQDTDFPISFIAYECGFQSIRSFNQVCKEFYDKTPSELRESRLLPKTKN